MISRAAALRPGSLERRRIRSQLGESWVYLIDAALSGVGLVVAEEMHAAPFAVLAVVPLLGLLAMFAHERHGRLGTCWSSTTPIAAPPCCWAT